MDPNAINNRFAFIPVLPAAEIKRCDEKTIQQEPISSLDLMERASRAIYNKFITLYPSENILHFICGPGNNGGDGLCMANMAIKDGKKVRISLVLFNKEQSKDNAFYYQLLKLFYNENIVEINTIEDLFIESKEVILDCIFGTGLTNKIDGKFGLFVNKINELSNKIVSIDIPSGLFSEQVQENAIYIKSELTITIQTPKVSFFYPENKIDFRVVNANINADTGKMNSFYLSPDLPYRNEINQLIPQKIKFGHKGTFGHAILIGGNTGMHGAIAIAANSCIEAGAGLTTVLAPAASKLYLAAIPKVMHLAKPFNSESINNLSLNKFSVLAVGPGLGNTDKTKSFLESVLTIWNKPILLDADALNIIAEEPHLWNLIKPGSIITPHPGEFNRLFGKTKNGKEKIELCAKIAIEKQIFILAKDTYSVLFTPDGKRFFNGSGGSWMAQGGSGDNLTGLITGLWARTGDAELAALCGMYGAGIK